MTQKPERFTLGIIDMGGGITRYVIACPMCRVEISNDDVNTDYMDRNPELAVAEGSKMAMKHFALWIAHLRVKHPNHPALNDLPKDLPSA